MKAKAPCKDCPKRHDGCHSHCEAYKAFRAEADLEREARRKSEDARCFLYDSRFRCMKKTIWRR